MNYFLLQRELEHYGSVRLIHSQFDRLFRHLEMANKSTLSRAHLNAVHTLDLEKQSNRFLLSGGAEPSIYIWDTYTDKDEIEFTQCGHTGGKDQHKYGISQVHWWPFDNNMFTSSSFDGKLKIWDASEMKAAYTFAMDSKVYSHAASSCATHELIACATESSLVRLCDLKSGAQAQALRGHHGKILSISWSPRNDYLLSSGGIDGTIRIWDVRRANAEVTILGSNSYPSGGLSSYHSHNAEVNGLTWTNDSLYLVSASRDDDLKIWDMIKGQDSMTSVGPSIRNQTYLTVTPYLLDFSLEEKRKILFPNDDGCLVVLDFEGNIVRRFRITNSRLTSVCAIENGTKIFTGASNGNIYCLKPSVYEKSQENDHETNLDKKDALSQIFKSILTTSRSGL